MKKFIYLTSLLIGFCILSSSSKVTWSNTLSGKVLNGTQWVLDAPNCNNDLNLTYELTLNIEGNSLEARGTWSHERRDGTIFASGTYNPKDASFELTSRGWSFNGKFSNGDDGTEAAGEMIDNPAGCTEFTAQQNTEDKRDYFLVSIKLAEKISARQSQNIEEIKRKAAEQAKRELFAERKRKAEAQKRAAAELKRKAEAQKREARKRAVGDGPKRKLNLKYVSSPAIDQDTDAKMYFDRAIKYLKRRQCGLALNYLGKLSKKRHTRSLNALGVIIKNGNCSGLLSSPNGRIIRGGKPQAIKYFRRAISQGSSRALLNLGEMYEKGDGLQKDTDVAVYLYGLAEQKGFNAFKTEARKRIKNIRAKIAAKQARLAATKRKAAEKKRRHVRMLKEGKAAFEAGKYARALSILSALPATKLDPRANYILGEIYATKNKLGHLEKSIKMYKKAVSAGSREAAKGLDRVELRRRQIIDMRKSGYLEVLNKPNCFVFVRKYDGGYGATWSGSCKNGKVSGQGELAWIFNNGGGKDIYVGGYRNGKQHGQGTKTWKDGSKYVGGHRDGKRHGQGTYTWKDGSKYVGGYRDGKWHGQGTYTWKSGSKYVGGIRDGKFHGQGTYFYADGDKYVGQYKNDKKNGQGTYTCSPNSMNPGTLYKGTWENGKKIGQPVRCTDYEAIKKFASVAVPIYSIIRGADSCRDAGLLTKGEVNKLEGLGKDNMSLFSIHYQKEAKWKGRITKQVIKAAKKQAWKAAKKTQTYMLLHLSALAVLNGQEPRWKGIKHCRSAIEGLENQKRLLKNYSSKDKRSGPRF